MFNVRPVSPDFDSPRPRKIPRLRSPETQPPLSPREVSVDPRRFVTDLVDVAMLPAAAEPLALDLRCLSIESAPCPSPTEPKWGYRWEDVNHCFQPGDTLSTICVIDTTFDDWRQILLAISSKPWLQELSVDDEQLTSVPNCIPFLLAAHKDASFVLSVKFNENILCASFDEPNELKFEFDCYDLFDQEGLDDLFSFCHVVQQSCHKRVEIDNGLFVFDDKDQGRPTGPFLCEEQ